MKLIPQVRLLALVLPLAAGACATSSQSESVATGSPIGCRGPYENVMARLLRLHLDLKITADQEFEWIAYEDAYQRYAEAKTAVQVGKVGARRRDGVDDDRGALRREVKTARDHLYASLSLEQKAYADTTACRLAYP